MGFGFPQLLPWLWQRKVGPWMVAFLLGLTFVAIAMTVTNPQSPSFLVWFKSGIWGLALLLWFIAIMRHTHNVATGVRINLQGLGRTTFPKKGFQIWWASLNVTNRPEGKAIGLASVQLLISRGVDRSVLAKATPEVRDHFLGSTQLMYPIISWILDDMVIEANANLSGSVGFIDHSLEPSQEVQLVIEELNGRKHRFSPFSFG